MDKTFLNSAARSVAFAAVLALALPVPAHAQFGGLLRSKPGPAAAARPPTAATTARASRWAGRCSAACWAAWRGVLGGLASFLPVPEVAGLLTDAIACKLEPEEQKQAADATLEATRGEEVGSTSTWTSDTRKDVSGTSTVLGKTQLADGSTCMNVNDVIIVEGEETTVSKRMCKKPGAARYEIAQA